MQGVKTKLMLVLAAGALSTAVPVAGASATTTVRECGRLTLPSGVKAWAYATATYRCDRAQLILNAWLYQGASADLRGWRCYSGTKAGDIVTCKRGSNRVHAQLSGRKGARVRVD